MNQKFWNQGFSLVEAMVSVGLLGAVALGMMALNSQQKAAESGIQSASDMTKVMSELSSVMSDPKACQNNFIKKVVNGGTLSSLKDANNNEILKVGKAFAKNTYQLTEIKIEEHDSYSERTRIAFYFKALTDNTRSKSLKRSFTVFSKVSGGEITECLDPVKITAEGALKKMCLDVDPEKEGDCEKNYNHLLNEVKMRYCQNHPYLEYDPYTGKCRPLDAGQVCSGGKVMRGYSATGKPLDCIDLPSPTYPAPDTNAVPNPTTTSCNSWSAWMPSESSVCIGTGLVQNRTCLDAGSSLSESQPAVGTMMSGSCCGAWEPATDGTCSDKKVTQTNKCGQTQTVDGTKSCTGGCVYKHPVMWDSGSFPVVQCAEWFNPVSNPTWTQETIPEGETRSMGAGYCPQGECYGNLSVKCENGKIVELSKSCKKGMIP